MGFVYYALTLIVGVIIGYIIVSIIKQNADRKKLILQNKFQEE